MSLMFKPPMSFDPKLVNVMLQENTLLLEILADYQSKGKVQEFMEYQEILTRNLHYLVRVSDFKPSPLPDESKANTVDVEQKYDQSESGPSGLHLERRDQLSLD